MDRRIRGCGNHHLLRHCRMTGSGSSEIIRVDFSLFPPLSRLQFTSDSFYCGCPRPVVLCKGAHFRSCNTKGEVNPLPQAFGSWFKKALKQQSSVTINSGNPLSTRLNPPIHNASWALPGGQVMDKKTMERGALDVTFPPDSSVLQNTTRARESGSEDASERRMSVENKRVWLPGKGDKVVLRFWIIDKICFLDLRFWFWIWDFGFGFETLDLRFERRMSRERISGCLAPGKGGQSDFEIWDFG